MKKPAGFVCLIIVAVMLCGAMFSFAGCKKTPNDATPIPGASNTNTNDANKRVDDVPAPTENHSIMQIELDWGIKTAEPLFIVIYEGQEYEFNASKLYGFGPTEAGAPYTETSKTEKSNYSGVSLKYVLDSMGIDVGEFKLQDLILYYADGSSDSIIDLDDCVFLASVISPYKNHKAVEPSTGVFFVATGDKSSDVIKEYAGVVKIEVK